MTPPPCPYRSVFVCIVSFFAHVHFQAIIRLESEISEYQKRIEQDAAVICTLEERLNSVVKKNKDYEAEVATLTQQNSGE